MTLGINSWGKVREFQVIGFSIKKSKNWMRKMCASSEDTAVIEQGPDLRKVVPDKRTAKH